MYYYGSNSLQTVFLRNDNRIALNEFV